MLKFLTSLLVALSVVSFTAEAGLNTMEKQTVRILITKDGKQGSCSGVIVSAIRVITAKHCIVGVTTWDIEFANGVEAAASPSWSSETDDVAFLTTNVPAVIPPAPIACRAPELDEKITVLGFPLGLGLTITHGAVISKPDARLTNGRAIIVSDVNVNHGNSGGPMFDAMGKVIGIVYGLYPDARWAIAVPTMNFCIGS